MAALLWEDLGFVVLQGSHLQNGRPLHSCEENCLLPHSSEAYTCTGENFATATSFSSAFHVLMRSTVDWAMASVMKEGGGGCYIWTQIDM